MSTWVEFANKFSEAGGEEGHSLKSERKLENSFICVIQVGG